MALKSKTSPKPESVKKRTSIGCSTRSRDKSKRASKAKYRGQGRA